MSSTRTDNRTACGHGGLGGGGGGVTDRSTSEMLTGTRCACGVFIQVKYVNVLIFGYMGREKGIFSAEYHLDFFFLKKRWG